MIICFYYLAEPWPVRSGRNGRHLRLWGWRASQQGKCSGCPPQWRPACGGCRSCTPLSRSAGEAQRRGLSLQDTWQSTSETLSEMDQNYLNASLDWDLPQQGDLLQTVFLHGLVHAFTAKSTVKVLGWYNTMYLPYSQYIFDNNHP